jgi:hypothetical protein
MEKATESPGKMAGGGEEDCGDGGEEFLISNPSFDKGSYFDSFVPND